MIWFIGIFYLSYLLGQLGAITFWPTVTVYAHDLLVLVTVWPLSVLYMKCRKKPVFSLDRPVFWFVTAGILSLAVNAVNLKAAELFVSSLYLLRFAGYFLVYKLVVLMHKFAVHWSWGLYLTGVVYAVLGLMQFILYPDLSNLSYLGWDQHFYRVFSTLLDPNFVAIIFVSAIFLGLGLWGRVMEKYRGLLVFSLTILFVACLLTYSRSGYLALISGLTCWFVARRRLSQSAIVGLLILISIVYLPKLGGDTLRLDRLPSIVSRVGNWQQSITLIQQSPIFGFGFNTLRYTNFLRTQVADPDIVSRSQSGLDSSLLFVWATAGLVGLAAYLWIIRTIWILSSRSLVLRCTLVALLVHSLFLNSLFYPWVMLWLWIVTGVTENSDYLR